MKHRCKGLGSKGNPLLRDIDLSPDRIFFRYFYIVYKGISVCRKNLNGPMKSLGAKFNCILHLAYYVFYKETNLKAVISKCRGGGS